MFNTGKRNFQWVSVVLTSAITALIGTPGMAGEPQEIVVIRRQPEQIVEIISVDGTTTRIPPNTWFLFTSPEGTRLVTAAELTGEVEKEDAKRPTSLPDEPKEAITLQRNLNQTIEIVNADGTKTKLPTTRFLFDSPERTKAVTAAEVAAEAEKAKSAVNTGRFQISPAGDSAILVDTVLGKTWLLYYADKSILPRFNTERGNTWKDMPCLWLPLYRPESDTEIQEILSREKALQEVSHRLRQEELEKAALAAREREEARRKARNSPGGMPLGPGPRTSGEAPKNPGTDYRVQPQQ